jgi:flagellar biosynthesis/type III secretory pathway protein FliH
LTVTATKFRFETSFDNGAHSVANAAALAQAQALEAAAADGEQRGFSQGHAQALSEIESQTATLLSRLSGDMIVLFDTLDSVKRQLIADSAIVATATGSAIGGRLIEKLPQAKIDSLVEELMNDVVDTPRLVLRLPPALLDSARSTVESMAQTHGFLGRLIFMGEPSYGASDVTIEWAHGGMTFSALEQQQRIQKTAQTFVDSVLGGGDIDTIEKVNA